ncbi:MAG: branched-chain amino acid aminotransferase [Rhodospirillaceae bacterium]|nr:branched-chain amino acid aminotransferase [Rhodospirillaceae bacterium]|tara:strand:- start:7294 stop:8172 length:879 start_codon:yes stop_codon:yes gene_type:complete
MADLIPFDDRDGKIWFDGKLIDWRDAQVHVLTHGLHYASSVFEGERSYGGTIYKAREHGERLFRSAEILGFEIPWSYEVLEKARYDVMAANGIVDGYIRPVAWRGSEMMGVSAQHNTIHVAIAAWDWPSYFSPEAKMRGIRLAISDWKRPSPESAPVHSKAAGLYMICTLSKHKAEQEGYDDAMMYDHRGFLAEATGANMFLAIDGKLHTPTADCFLNGLTRQTVMDLARRRGIEVVERHMTDEDLAKANEVFITGTAAEVTPVGQIGEHHFQPGRVCQQMLEDFNAEVRGG